MSEREGGWKHVLESEGGGVETRVRERRREGWKHVLEREGGRGGNTC